MISNIKIPSNSYHRFLLIIIHLIFIIKNFSLKMECEKLAQEKTEIQRQYIMVSELILITFIAHSETNDF